METGTRTPSAAPPTDGSFVRAFRAFDQARERFIEARDRLDLAQTEQAAAVNALPLPSLMQGPAVVITGRDSLERIETVLRMSVVGPHADHEIGRRLAEVREYRERLEAINERLRVDELGEDLFQRMNEGEAALDALMAVPAADDRELAAKMQALVTTPWEAKSYLPGLAVEARILAQPSSSIEWEDALAAYLSARRATLALPDSADGEDQIIETESRAEAQMIVNTPAPNVAALLVKVRVAFRSHDQWVSPLPDYLEAIGADVARLFPREVAHGE